MQRHRKFSLVGPREDRSAAGRAPGVNPAIAREVAVAFVEAPSTPRTPVVAAAYGQLERQSDALFAALTDPHGPYGLRVAFTRSEQPYDSDVELIDAVRCDGLLEVTVAWVNADRVHPLLGSEPGGAYDRFRAVHDLVGHVAPRFGFDRDGEHAAWLVQDRLCSGLARCALATELHGEHSVRWVTGEFAEHKAALLDAELVLRASRGMVNVVGQAPGYA
jgi:hypothetical protein